MRSRNLILTTIIFLIALATNIQAQTFLTPINEAINPLLGEENENSSELKSIYINPQPRSIDPRIQNIVFTFNNSYEYGKCLDILLLAYEGRIEQLERTSNAMGIDNCGQQILEIFGNNINADQMLQLIDLANFRATSLLNNKIFPSYGLRRRIAIKLGYIYEIDLNDRQMLEYAKSSQVQ
ncbi:hypothetical protein ACN4EE_06775 [Geminocystis sp. CENA526]|uniref:hypothetical protein n=1 Tax=Geminocystis sp. CENA526 TaxID=1355871 RepID=UPI003D6FD451